MSNKYALTHEQFEALRPHFSRRLTIQNIEAAYAVMVEDEAVQTIAEKIGKTRQHVHGVVRGVWALYQERHAPTPPNDWVRVIATLPADLAKSVKRMERDAMKKLGTDKEGKTS